jgi:hypothetical protein
LLKLGLEHGFSFFGAYVVEVKYSEGGLGAGDRGSSRMDADEKRRTNDSKGEMRGFFAFGSE